MYAQIGMFPLSFHKELYDYYNESVAHMCEEPKEYRLLQRRFDAIDVKCGCPDNMDVPMLVQAEWHKWAHARTLNAGYFLGESYKWEIDQEVSMQNLMRINSPLTTRQEKTSPSGLFPQSWPSPEESDELEPEKANAKILAALVMDDYDHRSATDYLSPGFPVSEHVVPEQRIRRAGHWLDLTYDEVDTALEYAQVLVDEGRVQCKGKVLQFPQETIDEDYLYMLGTREEARVDHNLYAQRAQRGIVQLPAWTGVDQYGATVQIYPPREMPGTPDTDYEAMNNALPIPEEELENSVTERLMYIQATAPSAETCDPPVNAQLPFSGAAHKLEIEPAEESISADVLKEIEEPMEVELKVEPTVPVPPAQMLPPPVPTDTPASSCQVREPPEWPSWQVRILQPAPKPLVPDYDYASF
eukprot:3662719-Amphidinium_carterae.1